MGGSDSPPEGLEPSTAGFGRSRPRLPFSAMTGRASGPSASPAGQLEAGRNGVRLLSSSLEPPYTVEIETTPQSTQLVSRSATAFQRWYFKSRLPEANRVIMALDLEGLETGPTPEARLRATRLARRLSDCCRYPVLYGRESTGELKIAPHRCRSRLCPVCGPIRANSIKERLTECVRTMDGPKFLTLTLQSSEDPLRQQIQKLTRCFGELRRNKLWKQSYKGGVYAIEVTLNQKTGRWHPHLHAIVDGTWCPHAWLSGTWERITAGSKIVDIRACHSIRDAVKYLCNYVSKSQDASHVPTPRIGEWADGMHGLRLASTFGALHGTKLEPEPEKHDDDWIDIGNLGCLAYDADLNEPGARALFDDVCSTARRGLPNGRADAVERAQARNRELIGRVRAWWERRENAHGDPAPAQPRVGRPRRRSGDGSLRLWENIGLADSS